MLGPAILSRSQRVWTRSRLRERRARDLTIRIANPRSESAKLPEDRKAGGGDQSEASQLAVWARRTVMSRIYFASIGIQ